MTTSTPTVASSPGSRTSSAPRSATQSTVLRWEGVAWVFIAVAWIVSAWPGVLVRWNGLAAAPLIGLAFMAVITLWQRLCGATWRDPVGWISDRIQVAQPKRRRKTRRHLATTVAADSLAWAASGVGWCVAARRFHWSTSVTGAVFQVGAGIAMVAWAALHIAAAARIASHGPYGPDPVVTSRRVLGGGAITVEADHDAIAIRAAVRRRRRIRLLQRWILNPPLRALAHLGLLPGHIVLETRGRRTGRTRHTVVGATQGTPTVLWIIAEHGHTAGYLHNIAANPHIRVRVRRRWHNATAHIDTNDDTNARVNTLPASRAKNLRRFSTSLLSLRADLES
jgi:deazaflavin-dependent oxidoreductase (nitroreductase family)